MLSFFPTPYPDEMLYSILARYHVRSGNTSPKVTLKELFGTNSITAVADMPGFIDDLASRIPKEKKLGAIELIMNNTLFPYYTAFLPEQRTEAIFNAMRGKNGGSIHAMTGIIASCLSAPRYLRYCPICSTEDKARYGELFWHRLHQMPGILLCPIHEVMILDSMVNLSMQNRHEFVAANEMNCANKIMQPCVTDQELDKLLAIFRDIEWIISHYKTVRETVTSDKWLRDQYIAILQERGYATINGRVYQERLISDFNGYYGSNFLKMVDSEVENKTGSNWLSGIVRKHRKSFHPVRHLLLISFLCGTAEDFFTDAHLYKPFGVRPWPCLNPAADHFQRLTIRKIKITHSSDTKCPVGTFVCSCGFIYSRTGPDPLKINIYKIGRIKQFGSVWEEKLRDLITNKDMGLRETARQLRVDPKTIKENAIKLGIKPEWAVVSKPDEIVDEVSRNAGNLLDYHRYEWIALIRDNSLKTKTELRKIAPAHFSWLYRHDRKWLDSNSPKSKSLPASNNRVNWKDRDSLILEEVKAVVNDILSSDKKPVRISLSRIGKVSGRLGLLEKHMENLPRTKQYINSITETDIDYRKRRIAWAVRELSIIGANPKVWNVMRKAGIRKEYAKEVEGYIIYRISEAHMRILNFGAKSYKG